MQGLPDTKTAPTTTKAHNQRTLPDLDLPPATPSEEGPPLLARLHTMLQALLDTEMHPHQRWTKDPTNVRSLHHAENAEYEMHRQQITNAVTNARS